MKAQSEVLQAKPLKAGTHLPLHAARQTLNPHKAHRICLIERSAALHRCQTLIIQTVLTTATLDSHVALI